MVESASWVGMVTERALVPQTEKRKMSELATGRVCPKCGPDWRFKIAGGLKTITLFLSYHEVDFAGTWLFGFGSLPIDRACTGKFANNETGCPSNRTGSAWRSRHNRARPNDSRTRAGISCGNRERSPCRS